MHWPSWRSRFLVGVALVAVNFLTGLPSAGSGPMTSVALIISLRLGETGIVWSVLAAMSLACLLLTVLTIVVAEYVWTRVGERLDLTTLERVTVFLRRQNPVLRLAAGVVLVVVLLYPLYLLVVAAPARLLLYNYLDLLFGRDRLPAVAASDLLWLTWYGVGSWLCLTTSVVVPARLLQVSVLPLVIACIVSVPVQKLIQAALMPSG